MNNTKNNSNNLSKNIYETNESYRKRQWFVINYLQYDKTTTVPEAIRMANLWINMINLGCRYPEPLERKIQQFMKYANKEITTAN